MNLDRLEILTDEELYELASACDKLRNKRYSARRQEAWDKVRFALNEYRKEFGDVVLLDVDGDEFASLVFNNSASTGELSTSYDY